MAFKIARLTIHYCVSYLITISVFAQVSGDLVAVVPYTSSEELDSLKCMQRNLRDQLLSRYAHSKPSQPIGWRPDLGQICVYRSTDGSKVARAVVVARDLFASDRLHLLLLDSGEKETADISELGAIDHNLVIFVVILSAATLP